MLRGVPGRGVVTVGRTTDAVPGHAALVGLPALTARLSVAATERLARLPNRTGNVCRS